MKPSLDRRRHKLVVHYADGRVAKGNTYKLDPTARGFYLIPLNPLPGELEVYISFADLKSVFYVKDFEGGEKVKRALEEYDPEITASVITSMLFWQRVEDDSEEYVPEGHEVTVEFVDGEVIKGFAFDYNENSPRFIVDIPDTEDNNFAILVERANTRKVTLGRVFRVKRLHRLVDSSLKMLLLKYYWDHPRIVITVKALAQKIERAVKVVRRDIQSFVNEGLMEWVGGVRGEKVRFLPALDEEIKEFIMDKLRVMK